VKLSTGQERQPDKFGEEPRIMSIIRLCKTKDFLLGNRFTKNAAEIAEHNVATIRQ
jgi:hypothetical protein